MTTQKLLPDTTFPAISVTTIGSDKVTLGQPRKDAVSDKFPAWQLIVQYRGQHCPLCTKYLSALNERISELAEVSVDVIAVSADSHEQLESHINREDKHNIPDMNFPVAYGLSVEQMQQLGVYISNPRSAEETDHQFGEHALFVVNEAGKLLIVEYANNPFVRADLDMVINGLKWLRENDYPIRGTFA